MIYIFSYTGFNVKILNNKLVFEHPVAHKITVLLEC